MSKMINHKVIILSQLENTVNIFLKKDRARTFYFNMGRNYWTYQIKNYNIEAGIFHYPHIYFIYDFKRGFPGGSVVKNPPVNAGDTGSIPGLGGYPGGGNGNSLQYSCLENPMDRGTW